MEATHGFESQYGNTKVLNPFSFQMKSPTNKQTSFNTPPTLGHANQSKPIMSFHFVLDFRPLKLSPEKISQMNMTVQEKVELMATQKILS